MFNILSLLFAPIVWLVAFLTTLTIRLLIGLLAWLLPATARAIARGAATLWARWRERHQKAPAPQTDHSAVLSSSLPHQPARVGRGESVRVDNVLTSRTPSEAKPAPTQVPPIVFTKEKPKTLAEQLAPYPPLFTLPPADGRLYVTDGRSVRLAKQ